jgi:iron complex outermembrane receptor protein
MKKSLWMISSALAAMAAPVLAQDVETATGANGPQGDQVQNTEPYAADIIVTATRRTEALSEVPLAVSAVTGDRLRDSGAFDIRQLSQLVPSLSVATTGSEANGSARIRGIGTVGDNPGLESSVAVFIDGVYRSRSGVGLNELGEIERIEVLRGPQGTLFGRNASAGLIHVISKKPSFDLGGYVEGEYGNYDYYRLAGAITGGFTDNLAARLDAVYSKRDGFLQDTANDIDINNRNRLFLRGQLLFEPSSNLSIRIIGDYTDRDERCCGAVYLDRQTSPSVGALLTSQNTVIPILTALGQPEARFTDQFSRRISVSPGRSFAGETNEYGVSAEVNWSLGAATLTSITAYRDYSSRQASDTDYSTVDILYRAPGETAQQREFSTFTQELRLQGSAFADKLDWLVGGFYADEDLTLQDALRFGTQYGRFATCRLVSALGTPFLSPGTSGCLSATGRAVLLGQVPGVNPPLGSAAAGQLAIAGLTNLDQLNDRGAVEDRYVQNSRNWALFTHNIFHVTDRFDVTVGLRYTRERKTLDATFRNDNTVCPQNEALLGGLLGTPLSGLARGIIGLSCQGNSTAELNGATIADRRAESEFTGTAVLSWKANDDLLLYASYSRGYKAGGFNLDRSALKDPVPTFASRGGAQALADNLQFDEEINNAFELGAKLSRRNFSLSATAFHQEFRNFQLNTFNGTVFLVQNINGCADTLGAGQSDQSFIEGASNYVAPVPSATSKPQSVNPAAFTGACAVDRVQPGLLSTGVELEASLRPGAYFVANLGYTFADTRFASNLVGSEQGAPLDPVLRRLPGRAAPGAPQSVVTASVAWTPPIGTSGLSGLVYIDSRTISQSFTGSDLYPQRREEGFTVVNARLGLRGRDERWALELWAQNLFDSRYNLVTFNSPFQQGGNNQVVFPEAQFPGGAQVFSSFLGEPRTYGLTLRNRF